MEVIQVILTALLSLTSLFIITKILGHKQVAQLDFFDYVNGITIGSIGAELATELEKPFKPLIALVVYGAVSLILDFISHKFSKSRKYINGAPTILMEGGNLYRKNFKKANLDLSEFMLMCREQGCFDLEEIQTAVFEHNGKLSILPKSQNRPLTPKDISITPETEYIGIEVIMDGRILHENITRMGRDLNWLNTELKAQNFKKAEEVFLAIYHPGRKKMNIYKNDSKHG